MAAAAELAEVTGWLLFDADRQGAASRLNREALRLARLSGDRRIELLTRHNVGLQAEWHRRSFQALEMVEVLKEQVGSERSPRLSAVVEIREARALAQMGRRWEALRALERARSFFDHGVGARDPDWTWWLDPAELSYHEGQVWADLRDWGPAADHLARAVDECPTNRPRDRLLYLAFLLEALVRSGAEEDVVMVVEDLTASMGGIGSSRTAALIHRAAARPSSFREYSLPTLPAMGREFKKKGPAVAGPCWGWGLS